MFTYLRYAIALRKLQKERQRTRAWFAAKESEIPKETANLQKLESLTHEEIFEIATIENKISFLQTTYLRNQAQRYLLPVPEFKEGDDGAWEFASTGPHYQLKRAALADLRTMIRKEKKERREAWQSWAALLVGLIGAMIGLIAAIKK